MNPNYKPSFPLFALLHKDSGKPMANHFNTDNFLLLFSSGDDALGYVAGKGWGEFRLHTLATAKDTTEFLRNPPSTEPGNDFTGVCIDIHRELPAIPLMFTRQNFLAILARS